MRLSNSSTCFQDAWLLRLSTWVLAVMLVACGGGSGGGGSSPWIGTKQWGVAQAEINGNSVAIDASGNVYVAGITNGSLDGNSLMGTQDFFLTKYNSSGVKQYTKQLGAIGVTTNGTSVATDASGNVYVSGYTNGGLDGNTLSGVQDVFLTKYNSSGIKQYTKQLGVSGSQTIGNSVATDISGNVYIAGYTSGGLDGNVLIGTQDFFFTKYNSSGVKQYTKQLGVAGAQTYGFSVAGDVDGNVFVAGSTNRGLDGNSRVGIVDFFLTKFDNNGVKQYTKQSGVAQQNTSASSVAIDTSGNVYVTGNTTGALDGNTLMGDVDAFLTKYSNSGVKQYTKQMGVAHAETYGNAVATDASGNVYITGNTPGDLNTNALTDGLNLFLTKFSSSGVKQYTKQLGVAGAIIAGTSVATDASGNAYVAGYTNTGLDGNTLIGATDSFVAKFSSSGVKQ